MRLRHLLEVTRPSSMFTAAQELKKHGWVWLSQGGFSELYENPKYRYVLKLYANEDIAYTQFIAFTRQYPSPHWPKFIGLPVKVTKDYSAIRIERLRPLLRSDTAINVVQTMNSYLNDLFYKKAARWVEKIREWPSMFQALDDLYYHLVQPDEEGIAVDISLSNTMLRGKTLVLTDPVTPP